MSFLPPALDFSATEVEIAETWKKGDAFRVQHRLGLERGDEVCVYLYAYLSLSIQISHTSHLLFATIYRIHYLLPLYHLPSI
jgi:hypothetical protein